MDAEAKEHIHLTTDPTPVSGDATNMMDTEFLFITMEVVMSVAFDVVRLMDTEKKHCLMGLSAKDFGAMANLSENVPPTNANVRWCRGEMSSEATEALAALALPAIEASPCKIYIFVYMDEFYVVSFVVCHVCRNADAHGGCVR